MKDYQDFFAEHGLSLVKPPEGDCSHEVDGIDMSWSCAGEDAQELSRQPADCIWTVVDAEANLLVVNGYHYVNRQFYLVTDKAYTGKPVELAF